MAEKSHNGEKHRLTDEQLRQLAEMTFQNAERIEQLTDLIYQLAIEAYNHGQPVKEIKEIQSAVQARKSFPRFKICSCSSRESPLAWIDSCFF